MGQNHRWRHRMRAYQYRTPGTGQNPLLLRPWRRTPYRSPARAGRPGLRVLRAEDPLERGQQRGVLVPSRGWIPRSETWQLERDVCERLVRQLTFVGDALAWRVFGFQRKHIMALCHSAQPGGFARRTGRVAELAHVEQACRDGEFAILRDLTNCLRIGDVSILDNDGTFTTIEVKTNPSRTGPAQNRRVRPRRLPSRATRPLPGTDREAGLCAAGPPPGRVSWT